MKLSRISEALPSPDAGQAAFIGPRAGGLEVFQLPEVPPAVQPIVEILPVQLLSLAFAARDGFEAGRFERTSKITNITQPKCRPHPASSQRHWLLYAVIAATCWGSWGVLAKGPSCGLSGWMTQILFTFALIPSVSVMCLSKTVRTGTDKPRGLFRGFVSGLIAAAGNICSYLAIEAGAETAIAILLTNVHPLVTIFIAYF